MKSVDTAYALAMSVLFLNKSQTKTRGEVKGESKGQHISKHILIGGLVAMFSLDSLADGFKVTGSMAHVWNSKSNSVSGTWKFEASTLGNKWLLRVRQENGQETVAGSDGNDFYCLVMAPGDPEAQHMKRYPGWVCSGNYPLMSRGILVGLPWLAFCSGNYLAEHQSNGLLALPALWLPCEFEPLAYIYTETYDPLPGALGLPTRVRFYPDAAKMDELKKGIFHTLFSVADSDRDKSVVKLAQYEGVSDPEAVYEVTSTREFHNMTIPSEFVFRIFTFHRTGKNMPNAVASTAVIGRVDSVEAITSLNALPVSSDNVQNIQVSDYRFYDATKGVGFVPYVATNSTWITNMSDAFLQKRFQQQLQHGKKIVNQQKFSKIFVLLLLVLTASAPLLMSKRLRGALASPIIGANGLRRIVRNKP